MSKHPKEIPPTGFEDSQDGGQDVVEAVLGAWLRTHLADPDSEHRQVRLMSTMAIQDELRHTLTLDDREVCILLLRRGYRLVPDLDGSPVWQFFV